MALTIPEEIWTVPSVEIPVTNNDLTDAIPPITSTEMPADCAKVEIPELLAKVAIPAWSA